MGGQIGGKIIKLGKFCFIKTPFEPNLLYFSKPVTGAKGSVTYRYCPRETSYGHSSGDPPHPRLRNVTHFLQTLRLSVVYKSMKGTLGAKPCADNEHT